MGILWRINVMNERYRKNENIVTRRIAQQTLLVPVTANVAELDAIYVLNELGTRIWGLIDSETSVDAIVEAVTREYEVGPEEATNSVRAFVDSLREAKLLVESESRGAHGAAELQRV